MGGSGVLALSRPGLRSVSICPFLFCVVAREKLQTELLSKGQIFIRRERKPAQNATVRHVPMEIDGSSFPVVHASGTRNATLEHETPVATPREVRAKGKSPPQALLSIDAPGGRAPSQGTQGTEGTQVAVATGAFAAAHDEHAGGAANQATVMQEKHGARLHFAMDRGLLGVNAVLACSACLLIYQSRLRKRAKRLPGAPEGFLGIWSRFQMVTFFAYVFFACALMFLQHRAGNTSYSVMSATIIVYALKCTSSLVAHVCKGQGDFASLLEPTGGSYLGRIPTWLLTLVPGGCLGAYDALSFLSLASLDPVTYQIVLHLRLVLITLLWQVTFRRRLTPSHWFAILLFFMATATQGLEQAKDLATHRGLLLVVLQIITAVGGNVMAEFVLKEVPVATDLLNACLYFEGLVVLLVMVCCTHGGPAAVYSALLAPAAWKELVADPWMVSSIVCMAIFGIVTAYFLREMTNLLKELSACFVLILSAVLEWGVLGSSSCTCSGIQAVVLVILAVGVYNAEPLENKSTQENRKQLAPKPLRKG
mmetsp:Transcript_9641/g.28461  ORF Transcript_9641/g.28461 Transcript_9641/m.28461 type:complete len:537 (-) Transcript_9641:71-1681(-)